jgi:tetratricopeptide (TPR) repeat protein
MTPRHGLLALSLFLAAGSILSPAQTSGNLPSSLLTAARAATSQAETGHCSEALTILTRASGHLTDRDLEKRVELDGVRCATLLQSWSQLTDFVRALQHDFPRDPEALYEVQGKWDAAERDYRAILKENPRYPGIHFRLARLLLSRPNPGPDFQAQAKEELQKELGIDPSNAGAEYISGELARQMQDFPAAVEHFSKASTLEPNFADAFLGLGMTLLSEKKYEDAVAPLETAVKLEPGNPAGHYSLATAYARTGHKEAAEREFALQQQTEQHGNTPAAASPQ